MIHMTMRDSATDYRTGWAGDGQNVFDSYGDLSTGFAGLGEEERAALKGVPAVGLKHILEALQNPDTRDEVIKLLRSSNPREALARQAERDVMEAAHPKGRKVVFRRVAATMAPKVAAVERAVAAAADPSTEVGQVARAIAVASDNPRRDMEELLSAIAMAEIAPEATFEEWTEEPGMEGMGRSLKKALKSFKEKAKETISKNRPLLKKVAIGAAVVTAVAITGGVILPAIAPAIGAAGAAIFGGIKSIFGAGAPAAPTTTPGVPTATFDQSYVDRSVAEICDLMKSSAFNLEAGSQADAKKAALVSYLVSRGGMTTAEAASGVEAATAGCRTGAAPSQVPPTGAPAGAPTPSLLAQIADAALGIYKVKLSGDVAAAEAQRKALVGELQQQGMSQSAAEGLVDNAIRQVAESAQSTPGLVAPPPGYEMPGEAPKPAEAGFVTGDLVKYGLIAAAALAVFSQLGGGGAGRGGGRRGGHRRSRR